VRDQTGTSRRSDRLIPSASPGDLAVRAKTEPIMIREDDTLTKF
jgi:hypothetical protein